MGEENRKRMDGEGVMKVEGNVKGGDEERLEWRRVA